jgi:hypothetical protein
VNASITEPRQIVQLLVASSLIAVLTLAVLVGLFTPARAAIAQSVSAVSASVSHVLTHATSAHLVAGTPQIICGPTGAGCP